MQTPMWTDDHSRAVADLAPRVPAASERELGRAWAAVRLHLPATSTRRPRRRLLVVIGVGIAAATLSMGGVAVRACSPPTPASTRRMRRRSGWEGLASTVFGYLPLVRKAAQGTDIGAMGAVLAKWSYCTPALMPDLPQAVPVSKPR